MSIGYELIKCVVNRTFFISKIPNTLKHLVLIDSIKCSFYDFDENIRIEAFKTFQKGFKILAFFEKSKISFLGFTLKS